MFVLLLLVILLAPAAASEAASKSRPCRADVPRGPAVPAPMVLRNSCGAFLLERNGDLRRLPPSWLAARTGVTGRRYGADLRIERPRSGRIVLRRQGKVVWRSRGLYRNTAGPVAFGPHSFAFATHRRGLFLTDLRSPERLVVPGGGLQPVEFRTDGSLFVLNWGRRNSILVVSPSGSAVRRHRYRSQNGYAFDYRTESLYFVTPQRVLVRTDGAGVRLVRPLQQLDGRIGLEGRHLSFSYFTHRGPGDAIRFAVVRRDGWFVSRWSWRSPEGEGIDFGPVASADVRSFAFRTVTRPRGVVVVYVLREGAKHPVAVFRHRGAQPGCGVNTSFSWNNGTVLYTATDGPSAIVDARNGTVRSLARVIAALPRGWPEERTHVAWLRDF